MVGSKDKILVVEDDVYLMEGIRDILELEHFEVVTASSGKEGLEILRSIDTAPDVIVSDIMMPVMDGYQFLNVVRSELSWLEIPFIFLTAKAERADENLGKELGADDYVTKPFEPQDLVIAVKAKLRRRDQLNKIRGEQILKIKRDILTILHHEFNTPLTYVVAYNDMLQNSVEPERLTPDTLRQYLEGIDAGATRLRRLVEDFILLVELETGEAAESFMFNKQPIADYHQLFASLIYDYKAVVAAQNQVLTMEINPNTPPIIGHREYLLKILRCLLDNAIKFGDAGNHITLRVLPDEQCVRIEVSDQGRGIPEHEVPHIFEPFYQIDREHFEDQGSGTGLAIVQRIMKLHGGEVALESVVGRGSCFSLVFPAHHA